MTTSARERMGIWFPTIRAGTGTDVFTERLAGALEATGIRCAIDWLPLRAEYAPWTVRRIVPPDWATIAHINSYLHLRFVPPHLRLVVTAHHCVHAPHSGRGRSAAQRLYHRWHLKHIERRALTHASLTTAVSNFTANSYQGVFGPLKFTVIPNGVDTVHAFVPPPVRNYEAPLRLLYVGSNARRKGVDLLPSIMRELEGIASLTVVGTANLGSDLPSNIRPIGKLASIDLLRDAYANAHALLLPSRLEGFGLVAAEAMACGLPVIATQTSALPEVVLDGKTGFLCPMDDVNAFVAAATKLAKDHSLLRTMSANARSHAAAHFGIQRMVNAYVEAYASHTE